MERALKSYPYLQKALALFADKPDIKLLEDKAEVNLVAIYDKLIPLVEELIWQDGFSKDKLLFFQELCREFERYSLSKDNQRHHICIVIPVADRPQHLEMCLQSILSLCEIYAYGGKNEYYSKISVLIAEDSESAENISKNRDIVRSFNAKGLKAGYFSLEEQQEIVSELNAEQNQQLYNIIGIKNRKDFSHKGASITRNISYLKLRQIAQAANDKKFLFYFIDSDQEFKINVLTDGVETPVFALNYFYYLDRLFSENKITVLTGKVVGDPPVSPSVMTANFLDDINHFFSEMLACQPLSECEFHRHGSTATVDNGAYHDMADLFGFNKNVSCYDYHCPIGSEHRNIECFVDFCCKLNAFFDGVHLTRKILYQHQNVLQSLQPARTIYTGNYIFTADALDYFIPFAPLKLRMAGPTMGRFIKKDIPSHFVSANLPMLHGRIVEAEGKSEYRPGIAHLPDNISLSGEFERQFYGDLMLFSVENILNNGEDFTCEEISKTVIRTELFLRKKYLGKLQLVNKNLKKLKSFVSSREAWWNKNASASTGVAELERFIKNIENNFGKNSDAMTLISDNTARSEQQVTLIINALVNISQDKTVWQEIMAL